MYRGPLLCVVWISHDEKNLIRGIWIKGSDYEGLQMLQINTKCYSVVDELISADA